MRWSLLLACFPVRGKLVLRLFHKSNARRTLAEEKLCSNDLRLGESELLNECGDLFLIALAAFD